MRGWRIGIITVLAALAVSTVAYALTAAQSNSIIAFNDSGLTLPTGGLNNASKAHLLGLYSGFYSSGGTGGAGGGIYGDDFGYTRK